METNIAALSNSAGNVLSLAAPHFFHVLKSNCPHIVVERVVEAMSALLSRDEDAEEEQPMNFKAFFHWLYLSSSSELRCALLAQVMQAWPVPLAFSAGSDVTFCHELAHCATETPTMVTGVSQLLNKLFYTRFEEQDLSAAGTIDLQ